MEEITSACPGGMQTSYQKPVRGQGRGRAETMSPKIQNRRGRGSQRSEDRKAEEIQTRSDARVLIFEVLDSIGGSEVSIDTRPIRVQKVKSIKSILESIRDSRSVCNTRVGLSYDNVTKINV